MEEKELIFLGAAVLLAPKVLRKNEDPENDVDIQLAVAQAHFLHEKVKEWSKMQKDAQTRRFTEIMRRLAKD